MARMTRNPGNNGSRSAVGTAGVRTAVTGLMTAALFGAVAAPGHPAHAAPAAEPAAAGAATSIVVVERAPAQAGQRCFEAKGTHHAKTAVGNTFYKFTHRLDWCTDGTNVVSVDNREHQFTEASVFASFESVVEDWVTRTPAPEVTSMKKARVDNCVPFEGCISSKYPFVRLTLRADGTAVPTTGESES
jgi:hypothetical protein